MQITSYLCGAGLRHAGLPELPDLLRLLLLAPLLEEWIVRAGVQRSLLLRGWRAIPAASVSAMVFSLLHAASGPFAMAMVLAPGIALACVYQRWRDWRLCALIHSLMNGFAMTICGF